MFAGLVLLATASSAAFIGNATGVCEQELMSNHTLLRRQGIKRCNCLGYGLECSRGRENACQCQNEAWIKCWKKNEDRCEAPFAVCKERGQPILPTSLNGEFPPCGRGLPVCKQSLSCKQISRLCIQFNGGCVGVCLPPIGLVPDLPGFGVSNPGGSGAPLPFQQPNPLAGEVVPGQSIYGSNLGGNAAPQAGSFGSTGAAPQAPAPAPAPAPRPQPPKNPPAPKPSGPKPAAPKQPEKQPSFSAPKASPKPPKSSPKPPAAAPKAPEPAPKAPEPAAPMPVMGPPNSNPFDFKSPGGKDTTPAGSSPFPNTAPPTAPAPDAKPPNPAKSANPPKASKAPPVIGPGGPSLPGSPNPNPVPESAPANPIPGSAKTGYPPAPGNSACPKGFLCPGPDDLCIPNPRSASMSYICGYPQNYCGGTEKRSCPAREICVTDPRENCNLTLDGSPCLGICI